MRGKSSRSSRWGENGLLDEDELVAAAAELDLHDPEVDGSGGDFLVLHVRAGDGVRWVLRAPRRESGREEMGIEGRVLDVLGDRLPVAIPQWTLRTNDFVGYRRLPGEPAAVKDPAGGYLWRHDVSDAFFDQLGRFLATLHAIPIAEFADTGVEFRSPQQVRDTIDRALHRARDVLGIPDALWARWREWVADDEAWPPHSVLVHADIHPGHTLVTPAGDLAGVLDWTDIVVGDPGADLRRPGLAGHAQAHRGTRRDEPGQLRSVRRRQRPGALRPGRARAVRPAQRARLSRSMIADGLGWVAISSRTCAAASAKLGSASSLPTRSRTIVTSIVVGSCRNPTPRSTTRCADMGLSANAGSTSCGTP
jgi:aminoglycoside phosphotransferase (APT) family kinase protein